MQHNATEFDSFSILQVERHKQPMRVSLHEVSIAYSTVNTHIILSAKRAAYFHFLLDLNKPSIELRTWMQYKYKYSDRKRWKKLQNVLLCGSQQSKAKNDKNKFTNRNKHNDKLTRIWKNNPGMKKKRGRNDIDANFVRLNFTRL